MSTKKINDASQLTATGTSVVKITNKQGQIMLGDIDVEVFNTGAALEIGNIIIILPCGEATTDLVVENTAADIEPRRGTPGWEIDRSATGSFKGMAPNGSYILPETKKVGFTFCNITLSHLVGDAQVIIKVYPPTGGSVPMATLTVTIGKIIDELASITLTTVNTTVMPGERVDLTFSGKGITQFTLTESTSKWIHVATTDGSVTRYPEKEVHYTLEGKAQGIRLQTQLTVGVLQPKLHRFELVDNKVDIGGMALLNWNTEDAEHVILTCDDKEIIPAATYPKEGVGVQFGPIKRPTAIHAYAQYSGVDSGTKSHNIYIADPRVESFDITAEKLEPGKRVSFKLNWVIKNTTRFQITEHYAGQTDVHKLPVPEGVTTCLIYPTHAETTYKLEALAMAKKKPEDELIKE
jgi:hypothetical protein